MPTSTERSALMSENNSGEIWLSERRTSEHIKKQCTSGKLVAKESLGLFVKAAFSKTFLVFGVSVEVAADPSESLHNLQKE